MTDYLKVSELEAITSVQGSDLMDISKDNGGSSYTSKKITVGEFAASLPSAVGEVSFWMDGGSLPPATGDKNWVKMPYDGIFTGWCVDGNAVGSVVFTVQKSSAFPTFTAISGTEKPTLAEQQSNSDTNLSTWTTSFVKGDYIRVSVDSISGLTKVLVTIYTKRS